MRSIVGSETQATQTETIVIIDQRITLETIVMFNSNVPLVIKNPSFSLR